MSKLKPAKEVTLAPVGVFRDAVKVILSNSKLKCDAQLAEFQSSNAKKHEAKK
jgi:hypothetical protein